MESEIVYPKAGSLRGKSNVVTASHGSSFHKTFRFCQLKIKPRILDSWLNELDRKTHESSDHRDDDKRAL